MFTNGIRNVRDRLAGAVADEVREAVVVPGELDLRVVGVEGVGGCECRSRHGAEQAGEQEMTQHLLRSSVDVS